MSRRSERKYLLRRFTQERELARIATDSRAAALHLAMAYEYERRLCATADDVRLTRERRLATGSR
jgi:hypothetical protein